ncbi:MAG: hypothetical protein K2J03_02980, partial [Muribaculaceae bacterium]|nr:hypothetical protein [Muribaculaceae bacterium]
RAASLDDVALSAILSFAWNNNKVVTVAHEPTTGLEALSSYTLHKGYPVNALFSYDFAGMQQKDGLQYFSWRDANGVVHISDITSEDFTVNDIVYSGSLDPKVMASFSPTVRWKGFSLSAMLTYYGGHVMRVDTQDWTSDGSQYGFGSLAVIDAVPSAYLNYWKEGGEKYPGNGVDGMSNVVGDPNYASHNVAPADFLKVRNLVLGYSFNDNVCRALHMQNLRLRFQINNLCYWARNDRGIDPEANDPRGGTRSLRTPRSYTFSINFSF